MYHDNNWAILGTGNSMKVCLNVLFEASFLQLQRGVGDRQAYGCGQEPEPADDGFDKLCGLPVGGVPRNVDDPQCACLKGDGDPGGRGDCRLAVDQSVAVPRT